MSLRLYALRCAATTASGERCRSHSKWQANDGTGRHFCNRHRPDEGDGAA